MTGGFNGTGPGGGSGNPLNTVEAFDIASNTWSSLPSLPESTKGHGQVTTADGRVWVSGGVARAADQSARSARPGPGFRVP